MARMTLRAGLVAALTFAGLAEAPAQFFYPAPPPPPYGYYPPPPPPEPYPYRRYAPPPRPAPGVPPAIGGICYTRWMSCPTRPQLVNAPCSCFTPDGRRLRGTVGF